MIVKVCKLLICLVTSALLSIVGCNLMRDVLIALEILFGHSLEFILYSTGALYVCIMVLLVISIPISYVVEGVISE